MSNRYQPIPDTVHDNKPWHDRQPLHIESGETQRSTDSSNYCRKDVSIAVIIIGIIIIGYVSITLIPVSDKSLFHVIQPPQGYWHLAYQLNPQTKTANSMHRSRSIRRLNDMDGSITDGSSSDNYWQEAMNITNNSTTITHTSMYLSADAISNHGIFNSSYPLLHGSTLIAMSDDKSMTNHCFKIQASSGKYLVWNQKDYDPYNDKSTTNVYFAQVDKDLATSFTLVQHFNEKYIKVCTEPVWLVATASSSTSKPTHATLRAVSWYPSSWDVICSFFGRRVSSSNIQNGLSAATAYATSLNHIRFVLEKRVSYHGVNLGGWMIPEVWMRRSFYNGTGLGWGGSLCGMVTYNRTLAEQRILESLQTWITENDIHDISSLGFNSIRLPIGYWNVIEDPYKAYAPQNLGISLKYIDLLFTWAEKYDLTVLVDLHGMPGSQNGMDHSGCARSPGWLESDRNIKLSLDSVRAIMRRYGHRKSFLGIELANEPGIYYSSNNHTALLSYYKNAYSIIRRYHSSAIVVFNELYDSLYHTWVQDLTEPMYYNVIMDLHLYDWQEPFTSRSVQGHIQDVKDWEQIIQDQRKHHPIMIGEWSMSSGTITKAGQEFVDASVRSFRYGGAMSWHLWNWKIERGYDYDEWDVQLQSETANGLNPLKNA